jgi:hypothetical protein
VSVVVSYSIILELPAGRREAKQILDDRAVHVSSAVERPRFGWDPAGDSDSTREPFFCRSLAAGAPPPEEKRAERLVAAARSLSRSSLAAAVP